MRKALLLILVLVAFFGSIRASHIFGGEIKIRHIANYDYEINLVMMIDTWGIAGPPAFQNIEVFGRDGSNSVGVLQLPYDTGYYSPQSVLGCGVSISQIIETNHYVDTITLSPSIYNDPGGYYFSYSTCCRISGINNLMNPSSLGMNIVTLFPPVVNASGAQFINSTPDLSFPINDFAINQHPFELDFGGIDIDGDSIAFELYTPFNTGAPTSGLSSPLTSPYPDPTTQFTPVNWSGGFNNNNQIHGWPGPNPSPNRLQVNANSGKVFMVPNVTQAYYTYGILCKEYRNGSLIGMVFRDVLMAVYNSPVPPNNPPQVHLPQAQALATWDADTMIFSGSPVCVQFGVTDPDSISDIYLEVVHSEYDSGDITFLQTHATLLNPDTFITALCFQPDSFLSHTTMSKVIAGNPACYDLKGDTLSFYFRFVGYSNAGVGGSIDFVINNSLGLIDLFPLLSDNPNNGGQWYDLDNSGLLNPNNQFVANYITSPVSYRFMYIDQQANYPADTSELTLNFVLSSAFEHEIKTDTHIYPNPSDGKIKLTLPERLLGTRAEVFNYDMKKIMEVGLDEKEVIIGIQQEGLFFIRIGNELRKIIIDK